MRIAEVTGQKVVALDSARGFQIRNSGDAGTVMTIVFELKGQQFMDLNA
jgi:hypothetical protein